MTIKIKSTATEPKQIVVTMPSGVEKSLLDIKRKALENQIIIPDALIAELEEFSSRNVIEEGYCEMCLKAYALRKAKEIQLDKKAIEFLENAFDCKTGHMGYYLDENKIIKI